MAADDDHGTEKQAPAERPQDQPRDRPIEALPGLAAGRPADRTNLRFLVAHPAHWVALGLGSGLMRPGPGTWGTALAWAIFAVLAPKGAADPATALIIVAVALIVGTWAAEHTAAMLGEADPSTIVVDEMVAFWLVLVLLPAGEHRFGLQALAFVLFRFFDITKPPPIRGIDRRWKNAVGVMADDLVAAFYTLVVIALGIRLT
jgi:phosphatidylglycerophosphatase A